MSLPDQIPTQNVPFAEQAEDGNFYIDINWYLFLYNIAKQVFSGNNGGGGSNPVSNGDLIDMVALTAASADMPQAYLQTANALLAAFSPIPDGADIAELRKCVSNLQTLIAFQTLPDSAPSAGAVIPITPGASPFTYTAIHNGTMFVSGSVGPTITLARYGVNVPMGMSDGTIPLRENDALTFTWSGGTPPTLNYLPNQ